MKKIQINNELKLGAMCVFLVIGAGSFAFFLGSAIHDNRMDLWIAAMGHILIAAILASITEVK